MYPGRLLALVSCGAGCLVFVPGCGGAAPAPSNAPLPAEAPLPPPLAADSEAPMTEAPASGEEKKETAPATPAEPLPAQPSLDRGNASIDALLDDFLTAEKTALSAGHDCRGACRALSSMQRATNGICSISSRENTFARCAAAEERVRAARDKVRSACGECPKTGDHEPVDSVP